MTDLALNENGYYPGEENYLREKAQRDWELSKYSTSELYDEINRRNFKPFNDSLKELKRTIDKLNGVTPERPF